MGALGRTLRYLGLGGPAEPDSLAADLAAPPRGAAREPAAPRRGADLQGRAGGDGDFHIAGRFEGDINVTGRVLVGEGAEVDANINARAIVVGGTVRGNLSAATRVEILPTGVLTGTLAPAASRPPTGRGQGRDLDRAARRRPARRSAAGERPGRAAGLARGPARAQDRRAWSWWRGLAGPGGLALAARRGRRAARRPWPPPRTRCSRPTARRRPRSARQKAIGIAAGRPDPARPLRRGGAGRLRARQPPVPGRRLRGARGPPTRSRWPRARPGACAR